MLAGRRLGRDRIEPPHRRRLAHHASEPQIALQALLCHQTPSAIYQWPTVFLYLRRFQVEPWNGKISEFRTRASGKPGTVHLSDGLSLGPLCRARLDLS